MPPKKKKITKKKPARKASSIKTKKAPAPQPRKAKQAKAKAGQIKAAIIGKITHYFPHVNAAVIKLKLPLKIGDNIHIKGHTTDIKETVTSMQINRTPITAAKKGDEIGLLVASRVRGGDKVYKAS